ncbi:MAG: ATP-binding cassette domain-containing protein, partial [Nocardioides sp.]|uniref:ATP-binding cassette domain-containing protein n=1 Tax=Nocardioides sp. TaxID=35761 RepID=UPI0032640547
ELADRITVLRRGAVVGAHDGHTVTVSQLAREMVGEDPTSFDGASDLVHLALGDLAVPGPLTAQDRPVVCRLKGVYAPSPFAGEAALDGLDLTVRSGEVLGIAGVVGSGQTTLAEVLAGFTRPRKGQVDVTGEAIAYVPENRHRDAVAMTLSLRDNLLLHGHRRPELQQGPWFNRSRVDEFVDDVLERSNVRHGGASAPISTLSGGNQQRLVVGRELQESPCLVVAHNPFRGLDVRAIQDVKDALLSAAQENAGVVMISPDLDELRQFAHRIVVLFAGRVVGEIDVDSDAETVGRLLGGVA